MDMIEWLRYFAEGVENYLREAKSRERDY